MRTSFDTLTVFADVNEFFCRQCSGRIFTHSLQKVTVVRRFDCLVCQDEFFVNNSLDIKKNNEDAVDLAVHLSRHSNNRVRLKLSSRNACLSIKSLPGLSPHIFRCLRKIWCRSFVGFIAKSHQARYMTTQNKKNVKYHHVHPAA
jgi:hypothetical protein